MSFATRAQATANGLLSKYGQVITVTRYAKSAFDPATGEVTTTTSTYNINAYTSQYTNKEIDNILVQQGDIRLIVYSIAAPLIDDVASIDSKDYRILDVQKVKVSSSIIMYKCQVRA